MLRPSSSWMSDLRVLSKLFELSSACLTSLLCQRRAPSLLSSVINALNCPNLYGWKRCKAGSSQALHARSQTSPSWCIFSAKLRASRSVNQNYEACSRVGTGLTERHRVLCPVSIYFDHRLDSVICLISASVWRKTLFSIALCLQCSIEASRSVLVPVKPAILGEPDGFRKGASQGPRNIRARPASKRR